MKPLTFAFRKGVSKRVCCTDREPNSPQLSAEQCQQKCTEAGPESQCWPTDGSGFCGPCDCVVYNDALGCFLRTQCVIDNMAVGGTTWDVYMKEEQTMDKVTGKVTLHPSCGRE